jgi:tetratricopeptide (TPR) repeat protein
VKSVASIMLSMLIASSCSAFAVNLTPAQQEEVKMKSLDWMKDDNQAISLKRQKKYAEAQAIYEREIAERKKYGLDLLPQYENLATLFLVLGKRDQEEQIYKDMVDGREKLNGPDDPQVAYPLRAYADCLARNGKTAEAKKLRERALTIEKEATAIPKFSKITAAIGSPERTAEADKMRAIGEKLMLSELQSKAFAYFNRAVELDPKNAVAYNERGEARTFIGQDTAALADFEKAIKLKPDLAKAYINRALYNENLKHYPKAILDFNKAIELNPKDTETMGSKAKLLSEMGKQKEAIETYTKLIAVDPTLYWPYIQRAQSYKAAGNYKAGTADISIIINRAPKDQEFYEYRAEIYEKSGDLQNALADYSKVIELNPKYSIAYHERAKIFEKLDGRRTPRSIADDAMAKRLGY